MEWKTGEPDSDGSVAGRIRPINLWPPVGLVGGLPARGARRALVAAAATTLAQLGEGL